MKSFKRVFFSRFFFATTRLYYFVNITLSIHFKSETNRTAQINDICIRKFFVFRVIWNVRDGVCNREFERNEKSDNNTKRRATPRTSVYEIKNNLKKLPAAAGTRPLSDVITSCSAYSSETRRRLCIEVIIIVVF